MHKEDLYVGMRVICTDGSEIDQCEGTVIDITCSKKSFDCLVEFDKYVNGHSGLGWGTVEGRYGHCYWVTASQIEELQEVPLTTETYDISYDSLFN